MSLKGKFALVTGASRGIGRGIALQLGSAGATVYVTGRVPDQSDQRLKDDLPTLKKTANEITERGGQGIPVYCDHANTEDIENVFKKIAVETNGELDILVNNVFSASLELPTLIGESFWECEPQIWDKINDVGLRNHYYCSVYAARMMVAKRKGLIINIGSIGGLKYFLNVPYGVGKCALDRMSADMAEELMQHYVAVISLWPGVVRTELMQSFLSKGHFDHLESFKTLKDSPMESPEFSGKVVVAFASDPNIMKKSGKVIIAADAGIEYKLKDIDGTEPSSLRSLKTLLSFGGFTNVAAYLPAWLRLPGWVLTASISRI